MEDGRVDDEQNKQKKIIIIKDKTKKKKKRNITYIQNTKTSTTQPLTNQ